MLPYNRQTPKAITLFFRWGRHENTDQTDTLTSVHLAVARQRTGCNLPNRRLQDDQKTLEPDRHERTARARAPDTRSDTEQSAHANDASAQPRVGVHD